MSFLGKTMSSLFKKKDKGNKEKKTELSMDLDKSNVEEPVKEENVVLEEQVETSEPIKEPPVTDESTVEKPVEESTKPVDSNSVLSLLVDVDKVVNVAIARGAYAAKELETAGNVYNEFNLKVTEAQDASKGKEEASVDVKLDTLASIKQMMDVAIARGKYQPKELVAVGTVYNRFDNLLGTALQKLQQAQQEQQEEVKEEKKE